MAAQCGSTNLGWPCWNFKPPSYAFALFLYTVAYFSYAPVRLYSANLIFGFIGGADLACVLDSATISGAGLDHVLDSAAVSGAGLACVLDSAAVGGAGLDCVLDSIVVGGANLIIIACV